MNSANRERVKELLSRAARLPPQDRSDFIRRAAGDDPQIVAEVLDLLSTLDDAAFLSAPTGAGLAAALPNVGIPGEGPGTRIDRYKLLQLIGEGGFGSVFLAEQTEPVYRKVALKIIKAGMDTKQVIARFEAERQALALMDHPNIARVLDVGATQAGRPFFVMELVRGEPVTAYCDRERLPLRQRLVLFRDVCNAVQHAHQKGVIHRDLKPSNVLVTVADGEPLPKVIDFGIAKATAARLTDKTLFTEMHQLIGTPEYMSPEQAEVSGVDIDTRSDVYSLGVLLYELLSGSTPIERGRLRSTPLAEIQRLIREEEPPRPSLRLATLASSAAFGIRTSPGGSGDSAGSSILEIARGRRSEPATLVKILRGDLDWIVMKCLEKDRRRRYATASALAEDVGRYLMDQPVLAMPPGRFYTMRKFVRRHRAPVVAAGLVAATLLVASGATLAFALSATRQRLAAEAALARAEKAEGDARARAGELEQVARFQQEQLSGIEPQSMGLKLRAGLLANARATAGRLKLAPEEAEARENQLAGLIAGSDFTGLSLASLHENFFKPALAAIDTQFANQPLVKARLLQTLATTLQELGMLDVAAGPQNEALAIRRRELGDTHPDTLESINSMGLLLQSQGKLEEAEPYHREALEKCARVLGSEHPMTLIATSSMGVLLHGQGRLAEAEPYYRQALEGSRRVLGDEHRDTLKSINNLGTLLWAQGKLEEAEPYFRESLEKRRRALGEEHADTATAINNMGMLLQAQGKLAEAEPYCRAALELRRRVLGDEHHLTLTSANNLGLLLKNQGNFEEAERFYREALEGRRRLLSEEHPDTLTSLGNMGTLLQAQGRYADAETYHREALEKRRRVLGEDHPNTLVSISNLGILLEAQGKSREIVELLIPAEPAARRAFSGGNAVRLGRFLATLGRARTATGEFALSDANLTEAHAILTQAKGATARDRAEVLGALVKLHETWDAAEPNHGHDAKAAEWRALTEDGSS
ncbi:MAG: serine/threonine protein kinase [Planctomycetes bacterium]|nr:serine/threonine protein kinase [Planctomycetota bacterium]